MEYQYIVKKSLLFGKEKPCAFFKINVAEKIYSASFVTLENFSIENFDDALNQLILTLNSRSSINTCLNENLYPSVHFFFLNLLKKNLDFSKIATAALIFNPTKEKIIEAIIKGFTTIKIKFNSLNEEITDLLNYFAINHPQIFFRIDFNQKLNFKDCFKLLKKFPFESIDYIEEPCIDCYRLVFDFPNKIAVDESFRKNNSSLLDYPLVYIIKPLLQPNLKQTLNDLIKLKKRIVISSSFELQCGIQTLKWIIKKNGLDNETHGFDTIKYYDKLPCF